MTNWEELKWRGLIKDTAGDDIEDKINNGEITFYLGKILQLIVYT